MHRSNGHPPVSVFTCSPCRISDMPGRRREREAIMSGRARRTQGMSGLFSYQCVAGSTPEPSEGPTIYQPPTAQHMRVWSWNLIVTSSSWVSMRMPRKQLCLQMDWLEAGMLQVQMLITFLKLTSVPQVASTPVAAQSSAQGLVGTIDLRNLWLCEHMHMWVCACMCGFHR